MVQCMSEIRPFVLNHNVALATEAMVGDTLESALSQINGNSGNSYITYSVARHTKLLSLEGISNFFEPHTDHWVTPAEINEKFTHVFLILQDHLRLDNADLPWERATDFLMQINRPIVVFSLGANAISTSAKALACQLPSKMLEFFSVLSHGAESMGIRGDFTAEVLDRIGIRNHVVVGCPSLFEAGPFRMVRRAVYDPLAGIAATGLFSNTHENIHFFLQDEVVLLRSLFAGYPPTATDIRAIADAYPAYRACVLAARFKDRMHFFLDINEWKSSMHANFMLAAGTRLHGAIIALNQGVPALCTNGDQRAAEICRLANIPHFPGHCCLDYRPQELCEMADPTKANANYSDIYSNFRKWLVGLGIASDYSEANAPWRIRRPPRRDRLGGLEVLTSALFES